MELLSSETHFNVLCKRFFKDMPFVLVYIDNIWIVSPNNYDTHLNQVLAVIARCSEKHIRLNLKKPVLFKREFVGFGHHISAAGISLDPRKASAAIGWDPLSLKKCSDLSSFLGSTNYFVIIPSLLLICKKRLIIMKRLTDLLYGRLNYSKYFVFFKMRLLERPLYTLPIILNVLLSLLMHLVLELVVFCFNLTILVYNLMKIILYLFTPVVYINTREDILLINLNYFPL